VRRLHRVHLGETHTHTQDVGAIQSLTHNTSVRAAPSSPCGTLYRPHADRVEPLPTTGTPRHTHTHFTDLHVSSPTLICTSRTS
jgi:hypothetical protein